MAEKRDVKEKKRSYGIFIGILCLILGISLPLSLIVQTNVSILNFWAKFASYFMGKGALLLAVYLIFTAYCLLRRGSLRNIAGKTLAIIWISACILCTLHHVFVPLGEELQPGALPVGGGLVGGLLALGLHRMVNDTTLVNVILALSWFIALCILLSSGGAKKLLRKVFLSFRRNTVEQGNATSKDMGEADQENTYLVEERTSNIRTGERNQGSVYQNSEFGAFTKGLRKETGFKKIIGFTRDSIQKRKTDTEGEDESIQIPEWQSEEKDKSIVLRPVVDYGEKDANKARTDDSHFRLNNDTLIDDRPEPRVEEGSSIIKNIYKNYKGKTQNTDANKDKSELKTKETKDISIFDSADKQRQGIGTQGDVGTELTETEENISATPVPNAKAYRLPPTELLDKPKPNDSTSEKDIMAQCSVLERTLSDFKVRARVVAVTRGPSVTRFELEPAPGVKVSSVVNLADDIALRLAAPGVRIEAPIPGKSAIGIEVPNVKNDQVCLREVVTDDHVQKGSSKLCVGLGKDISGNVICADLAKMPHLLVAGSTGSGKSVCINTIISGILFKSTPDEVKLILVDPKVVELTNYNGIPHLLTPVVTEPRKAASALRWAVGEMERRYKIFADSRVREINSYNKQTNEKLPFIVIIIDELSDLMMVAKVDVEDAILRLAQKARAAGIHLILATQRPSVDVITGIVKANIPSRIAFAVSSQTDSRTIIDMAGAEKLLGKGDMLYFPAGFSKPVRVQGAFVSDHELERIVGFITQQSILPEYREEVTQQELESTSKNSNTDDAAPTTTATDELFVDALELVLDMGQASSSMLQRRFRIGYTRAARLVDTMEELGIVGHSVGSKPREVIMSRQEAEERFMQQE